ncbi:MAG TPA: GntR family transcriptional regulator [Ignavibacteria bacterium]|nr:GntR family transcriptional regulator [Ignavibacteria bacterium]
MKFTINTIYYAILKDIVSDKLKSGEHLKESEIGKRFNVSRIPVREALLILENEKYIIKIPNKGNFVRKLTKDSVEELMLMYESLVPIILNDAIPRFTAKTYSSVDNILNKIESSRDSLEITFLIWEFKKQIFKPTKFKDIKDTVENVFRQSMKIVCILIDNLDQKKFNVSSYRKFMKLCSLQKKDKAVKVFMDFLKVEKTLLFNLFEKK